MPQFYCLSLILFLQLNAAVSFIYLFIYIYVCDKINIGRSKLRDAKSKFYLHLFPFANILVVLTRRRQPHITEGQLSLWLPTNGTTKRKGTYICNIFNRDTLNSRLTFKPQLLATRAC